GELKKTYDGSSEVELVEISCPGRCDIAPAATVNDRPCAVADLGDRVDEAREADGVGHGHADAADTTSYGPADGWPNDPYRGGASRYQVLRRLLTGELSVVQVLGELQESGLRGMGGAGFPTGKKWELVRAAEGPVKYAICNADESEPGTFKDRQL